MFDEDHPEEVILSTTIVTAEGCFGAVTWNVCNQLYTVLPRDKRDELLEDTGEGIIKPFFNSTVVAMLAHVGRRGVKPESLDTSWAMENGDFQNWRVSCGFGTLTWQIGQGLWDCIPIDQRNGILELKKVSAHEFMEMRVMMPLLQYARRSLG